jgi:amiloride-sensitive sodium channel
MVRFFSKFSLVLKEYCMNSSLAGLSYVADSSLHYSERIFWLVCIIASWVGSAFLIIQYVDSFFHNSVSMSVMSLHPSETLSFPSAGICEMGYTKEEYKDLEKLIREMVDPSIPEDEKEDKYNFDVEDFLLRVIFHNLYNYGSMSSYCTPYIDCDDDCIKCPMNNYQQYADRVRANCSRLFSHCAWNDIDFDCCDYFRPVRTSLGTCFLLNSLQATERGAKDWLSMTVGMRQGNGHLNVTVTKSSALYILNEEDVPHMLLNTLKFPQIPDGYSGELLVGG